MPPSPKWSSINRTSKARSPRSSSSDFLVRCASFFFCFSAFVMWHSRIQRCRYHHLVKSLEEYLVKLLVVFLIVEFGQENHHYHYLTRDTDHPPTVQPSCPVLQPSSCPVSWVLSELVWSNYILFVYNFCALHVFITDIHSHI